MFPGTLTHLDNGLRYEPFALRRTPGDGNEWHEIVRVVESFGTNPADSARDAAVYHPLVPGEVDPVTYTVEVVGNPDALVPRFRQISAAVDPEATTDPAPLSFLMAPRSFVPLAGVREHWRSGSAQPWARGRLRSSPR